MLFRSTMFLLFFSDRNCSGRSVATLLIAWAIATMVVSVLLRWRYMWIILAALTLLFLFVCAYTAYTTKTAYERDSIREDPTISSDATPNEERDISTITGRIANPNPESGVPMYAHRYPVDTPPSYASAIAPRSILPTNYYRQSEEPVHVNVKHSSPPPYAIAIQSASLPPLLGTHRTQEADNSPRNSTFTIVNQHPSRSSPNNRINLTST